MPRKFNFKKEKQLVGGNKKKYIRRLEEAIRQDEFTIQRRGRTIGGMYYIISTLVEHHPSTITFEQAQEKEKKIENLERQLKEAVDNAPLPPPGSSLSVHFECPICFEPYDKEKRQCLAFSCGHVLCKQSLIDMNQSSEEDFVYCPQCREKQPLTKILALYL